MNKNKVSQFFFGIFLAIVGAGVLIPARALAVPSGCPGSGVSGPPSTGINCNDESTWPQEDSREVVDFSSDADAEKLQGYVQDAINILTALAGLAITAAIIISGIQYSASGGNPSASSAAKKRIANAFLALLALVFLYTFLQWIVPGGAFTN